MSVILQKVSPIIEAVVEANQAQLVDMEYVKEGKHWFLRIFVDKEKGVDLDDCALISEQLSAELDKIQPDPFPDAYYLEVSSPGVERPLKSHKAIQEALGQYVHFDYYAPIDGDKFHEGTLVDVQDDIYQLEVMVKTRKKRLDIPRDKIAKARLAVKF